MSKALNLKNILYLIKMHYVITQLRDSSLRADQVYAHLGLAEYLSQSSDNTWLERASTTSPQGNGKLFGRAKDIQYLRTWREKNNPLA